MIRTLASLVLLVIAVVTPTGCMTPEKRARLEKQAGMAEDPNVS
jgi:hypothetical protein